MNDIETIVTGACLEMGFYTRRIFADGDGGWYVCSGGAILGIIDVEGGTKISVTYAEGPPIVFYDLANPNIFQQIEDEFTRIRDRGEYPQNRPDCRSQPA